MLVRYIDCCNNVKSIQICIIYIRGVERGENTLKSLNTFSVIPQIHPLYYLPRLLNLTACKHTSNMTAIVMLLMHVSYFLSLFDICKITFFLECEIHICYLSFFISHIHIQWLRWEIYQILPSFVYRKLHGHPRDGFLLFLTRLAESKFPQRVTMMGLIHKEGDISVNIPLNNMKFYINFSANCKIGYHLSRGWKCWSFPI